MKKYVRRFIAAVVIAFLLIAVVVPSVGFAEMNENEQVIPEAVVDAAGPNAGEELQNVAAPETGGVADAKPTSEPEPGSKSKDETVLTVTGEQESQESVDGVTDESAGGAKENTDVPEIPEAPAPSMAPLTVKENTAAIMDSVEYSTIKDAVDAWNALESGDHTIVVKDGSYTEGLITVNETAGKSLEISAENSGQVTMSRSGEAIFKINSNSSYNDCTVKISGIHFSIGSGCGIIFGNDSSTRYSHGVTISSCSFSGSGSSDKDSQAVFSAAGSGTAGVTLSGCTVSDLGYAVNGYFGDNGGYKGITLKNCNVSDVKVCVNNQGSGKTEITGSTVAVKHDYAVRTNGTGDVIISGSDLIADNSFTDGTAGLIVIRDNTCSVTVDDDSTFVKPAGTSMWDLYTGVQITLNGETAPAGGYLLTKVAKIGNKKYTTLDKAVADAKAGDTVEIIADGTYKLPSSVAVNITIKGTADNVKIDATGTGSISSVPNGITFDSLEFDFGSSNYHGFQHAGTVKMKDCTLNGLLFSYGDMNFKDCRFVQTSAEYNMWAYGGNIVYDGCEFDDVSKALHLYNEGTPAYQDPWQVTVKDCSFTASVSSAKGAVNIKTKVLGETNENVKYTLKLEGTNTVSGFTASESVSKNISSVAGLVMTDAAVSKVTSVYENGVKVWPVPVAKIGSTPYYTMEDAVAAAKTGDTINVLASSVEMPAVTASGVTIKGNGSTKITSLSSFAEGTVIDGFDFTTAIESTTLNNFTVKNSKFTGKNGIRFGYAKGKVNIENCEFATTLYGIHFDGDDGEVYVRDCTITGFNTFAATLSVLRFEGCDFADSSINNYYVCQSWGNIVIENCAFSSKWCTVNDNQTVGIASGNGAAEVNGCSVAKGTLLELCSNSAVTGRLEIDAVWNNGNIISGDFVGYEDFGTFSGLVDESSTFEEVKENCYTVYVVETRIYIDPESMEIKTKGDPEKAAETVMDATGEIMNNENLGSDIQSAVGDVNAQLKISLDGMDVEVQKDAASTAVVTVVTYDVKPYIEGDLVSNEELQKYLEETGAEGITFRLPVPSAMTGPTVQVRHIKEDKTEEIWTADVEGEGTDRYVTITASEFSVYEIAQLTAANAGAQLVSADGSRKFYVTVNEAIAEAESGSVVTALKDSSDTFVLPVGVTFIVKDGVQYTGTVTAPEGYEVSRSGNVYTVVKKTAPQPAPSPTPTSDPKTGDTGLPGMIAVIVAVAAACAAVACVRLRKQH